MIDYVYVVTSHYEDSDGVVDNVKGVYSLEEDARDAMREEFDRLAINSGINPDYVDFEEYNPVQMEMSDGVIWIIVEITKTELQ